MKITTSYYSTDNFWRKHLNYTARMGYDLCVIALTRYFALIDPATPAWARAVIAAALGYLIMPSDAVPDIVPLAGYTDDASFLGIALATVAAHVTDEHRAKARQSAGGWFGSRLV